MASEYEKKFAEMKKYIPFLESMIKRLENTSTPSSNPRQAQLDKIRSLRDLLLDKNKRMKMENLLKCEQVLINLYSKVEQKVSVPKDKHQETAGAPKEHLDAARSKLKTISKISKDTDTLPEIARASEIEETCTPGSKEPALFQRRPFKHSPSPRSRNSTSPQTSASKKNYTRVLVSPESSPWRKSSKTLVKETTMYTRRSPRRSPKRLHPPLSNKNERKKSLSESKNKKLKDFNITLNVPEESLNSLNTKDILSRIINCSDGDVDIKTLRELRTQILGELKQTGGSDDISDLILKSYKNKKTTEKSIEEVEEGELSDSESEAIENIYGSVVIVDKNKQTEIDKVNSKEESRKIQICLVINSTSDEKPIRDNEEKVVDSSDFEIFSPSETEKKMLEERQKAISLQLKNNESVKELQEKCNFDSKSVTTITNNDENGCDFVPRNKTLLIDNTNTDKTEDVSNIHNTYSEISVQTSETLKTSNTSVKDTEQKVSDKSFRANFYKPLNDDETEVSKNDSKKDTGNSSNQDDNNTQKIDNRESQKIDETGVTAIFGSCNNSVQIPLLNEPTVEEPAVEKDVVSQIDILKALKNEILGENITLQSQDAEPPLLHQPKIVKVTKNANIFPKKRISIEKYKEKSISSPVNSSNDTRLFRSKEEINKKQSLKLTDKECERFQLPVKASSLVESVSSEDDEIKSEMHTDEIYRDLAPKSPDNDVDFDIDKTQPVIIPVEPVKTVVEPSTLDIDMRKLPSLSPNPSSSPRVACSSLESNPNMATTECRVWGNVSQTKNSPISHTTNIEKQQSSYPNVYQNVLASTPSRTPNMTPNARTYEMTPNYTSFELEDNNTGRKHVYASTFGFYESNDSRGQSNEKRNVWDYGANRKSNWSEKCEEKTKQQNEDFRRRSQSQEDSPSYNEYNKSGRYKIDRRVESPTTSDRSVIPNVNNFSRIDRTKTASYSRLECPATPSHPFGRLECPPTPVHYFGNAECPQTPNHPFGRPEPLLRIPFGRLECPSTPNTAFGRVDTPMTPSHSFGGSDGVPNQSYPYKRDGNATQHKAFSKDPRLNRSQWTQETNSKYNDREHGRDRNYGYERSYNSHRKPYNGTESYRYDREQSVGRNERNRYSNIVTEKTYRPSNYMRRDSNDRESSRDRESFYSRNRNNHSYLPQNRAKSIEREPGRDFGQRNVKDNVMAVKSHSGKAFAIDTSVNASFQDFISKKGLQVYDLSFDSRRKRASSVGRDLGSVNSKSLSQKNTCEVRTLKPSSRFDNVSGFSKLHNNNKNDKFRRASSVGRDIIGRDSGKSFQEVKDDFQLFKSKIELRKCSKSDTIRNERKCSPKPSPDRSIRSRKDVHEMRQDKLKNNHLHYSPTKNRRDPRMRRDNSEYRNKMRIDNRSKNTHGIVYSSDNIAKGAVLGSGYGVKNYKIPKIKRVTESTETIVSENKGNTLDSTEKEKVKTEKNVSTSKRIQEITSEEHRSSDSDDNKISKINKSDKHKKEPNEKGSKKDIKEKDKGFFEKEISRNKRGLKSSVKSREHKISDSDDSTSVIETQNTGKRITRSRIKNILANQNVVINDMGKQKKTKKPRIYDSDSEVESINSTKDDDDNKQVNSENVNKNINLSEDNSNKSHELGAEMLGINTENITSDFVIASINAFIADSCNEIDTSKNDDSVDFSDDISLQNILDNIVNSESLEDGSFDDIDEVISKDLKTNSVTCNNGNETSTLSQEITKGVDALSNITTSESDQKFPSNSPAISEINEQNILSQIDNLSHPHTDSKMEDHTKQGEINLEVLKVVDDANGDAIVSTTEDDKDRSEVSLRITASPIKVSNDDVCSTCDNPSTEMSQTVKEQSLPDSTNEFHNDENSNVTSSHIELTTKGSAELNQKTLMQPIDSIGSILTLLQDKSKIKQLLSMLDDDSAENEKIKKKLERISQIVSDEELKEEEIKENEEEIKEKEEEIKEKEEIVRYESDHCLQEVKEDSEKEVVQNKSGKCTKEISETVDDSNKDILEKSVEKPEEIFNQSVMEDPLDHCVNETKEVDFNVGISRSEEVEKTICDDVALTNVDGTITTDKGQNEVDLEKFDDKIDPAIANVIPDKDLDNMLESKNGIHDQHENTIEATEAETEPIIIQNVPARKRVKKGKGRCKKGRWKKSVNKQITPKPDISKTKVKKPSRELLQLREDIKEIFSNDDVLNATGLRMCRLAKLVDEKQTAANKDDLQIPKPSGLRKLKDPKDEGQQPIEKPARKKPGPKPKLKINETEIKPNKVKQSEQKITKKSSGKYENDDPYEFESDSFESSTVKDSGDESESDHNNSDSSLSKSDNIESLVAIEKKTTRKRLAPLSSAKQINKKQRTDEKLAEVDVEIPVPDKVIHVIDKKCFTDKLYCFQSKIHIYSCRLCEYCGDNIVTHYKKNHPHCEIPLSRMDPLTTKRAIEQCARINSEIIKQLETSKYICRFCSKEFSKSKENLERFFWHVVSMHTGEYKISCSECEDEPCSFKLDIPPPPAGPKGQLIGYVCSKCNYTQLSLENLKTHVVLRHNDEHTDVFTVNLALLSNKMFSDLLRQLATKQNEGNQNSKRVVRNTRSSQSSEASDKKEESNNVEAKVKLAQEPEDTVKQNTNFPTIQSKIRFEGDENTETSNVVNIKMEKDDFEEESLNVENLLETSLVEQNTKSITGSEINRNLPAEDIITSPHFKVCYKESGAKEYICCVSRDNHYKTSLLISMKKHVQLKHTEKWDGFCCLCKVIVMPQGTHLFKECLQHFLDKHLDDFPVSEDNDEKQILTLEPKNSELQTDIQSDVDTPKPLINVRPLSQLISGQNEVEHDKSPLPIIEKVVSLGDKSVPLPEFSPKYPVIINKEVPKLTVVLYEEWQADIMSKKHRVVLEAMMEKGKLVKIYKCAGRFCSFTSDSVEEALMHASTHQRIGGENALCCVYCDFDSSNNGIDLVMHVFKAHGNCQYACALCFYRAAASQSVATHISKAHVDAPLMGTILHTTNVSAITEDSSSSLSREEAVAFYQCGHSESIGDARTACSFRTYTATKFYEHLQEHSAPFTCGICNTQFPTAPQLIQHMSVHDMGMYQCAWCVFGADSEIQIISHSSSKHPSKQPQAYLRVITSKEGAGGYRVLPLANMSQGKFKVPTVDVSPGQSEDPVREAERSLDLEKLIRHIDTLATSQSGSKDDPVIESKNEIVANLQPYFQIPLETSNLPQSSTENINEQPQQPGVQNELEEPTLIVPKKEPQDDQNTQASSNEVIYCADSDEEEDSSRAVDASPRRSSLASVQSHRLSTASNADSSVEDENYVKISITELCRCPYCHILFRGMAGFRKHALSCSMNYSNSTVPCPHGNCHKVLNSVSDIMTHYDIDHRLHPEGSSKSFICGVCDDKFLTMATVKKHLKAVHKVEKCAINVLKQGNIMVYTIRPHEKTVKQTRMEAKRKLSADSNKMKRFGPQDINQLPINPILDSFVYCSLCEFSTKVRLNMVRHLQLHTEQQPVPQTEPVNPVPHLETNEKHFDKMVNLASSSIVTRATDKPSRQDSVNVAIPVEAATRYPKFVPERQRYVCGAKGCAYISLDEDMLKRHWEALHLGCTDYRCAHCPPFQYLDTTKPLTSARIIGHLKMHEATLYACSSCSYYHFKRQILERHLDQHKSAHIITVREESSISGAVNTPAVTPTMDLKPWQCGLCQFKCMLRPEIIEHCFKMHQSKMQFKCSYCPYRTSDIENILKHQNNAHSSKEVDVFYYFYREGSLPDQEDGTPRWRIQRDKMGLEELDIKTEVGETNVADASVPPVLPSLPPSVDLNIVKKEITEETSDELASLDELCKIYGHFCEPNGIKYKCSLCKVVFEDTKEAMQSHLYEELNYRTWQCGICSYKAFQKSGLNDHVIAEHRGSYHDSQQLPRNVKIEKWVHELLEYQTTLIQRNKDNLIKQKVLVPRAEPRPSIVEKPMQSEDPKKKYTVNELEEAFGSFCTPFEMQYRCPKCSCTLKEESAMREHLESELSKIRWCCSNCSSQFQTYHEAQFHCKSHVGQSARPKEALRDPLMRKEWVSHIISTQKVFLHQSVATPTASDEVHSVKELLEPPENSLLVVRYEERVPTPENRVTRKRPAPTDSDDDEKLFIDEPKILNKNALRVCQYCSYKTRYHKDLRSHILRHYGLRPFKCGYCDFSAYKVTVMNHLSIEHPNQPCLLKKESIPSGPPLYNLAPNKRWRNKAIDNVPKEAHKPTYNAPKETIKPICLHCGKSVNETEMMTHLHDGVLAEFAKKGDVVVKCGICFALCLDVNSLQQHHNNKHVELPVNYAFFKLTSEYRQPNLCGYCNKPFRYVKDLRTHHNAVHANLTFKPLNSFSLQTEEIEVTKRKASEDSVLPPTKRVAKKSTTKPPKNNAVARKSTTKPPGVNLDSDSESEEHYSYYGTKPPSADDYANVTTMMPFCNSLMPFTVKKLREIIQVDPKVVLKDIRN